MPAPTIFSRFLSALGVPHTSAYSDEQFRGMTFKSLFGLSHLMTEYGIKNEGIRLNDKNEITKLTPPFLAQTNAGVFVIVTGIDRKAGVVDYDSRGEKERIDIGTFINAWNGVALLAFPDQDSREPEYGAHRLAEIVGVLSHYFLWADAIALFAYFFITRGLYAHVSTILLALFNCIGFYFTYMLMQKSLNIHSAASDRVCGVLEHGGCDSIIKLPVSKLFGVFSWSEIGFSYFGVSLAALLLFPHLLPALALCNLCCLPYTFWSIWYQKFRAHHWCTLCVGVQSTLWLLFFSYLGGGWVSKAFSLHADLFVLIGCYIFVLLAINMVTETLKNLPAHEKNSGT